MKADYHLHDVTIDHTICRRPSGAAGSQLSTPSVRVAYIRGYVPLSVAATDDAAG
jgi:hypothetical protein